MNDIPKITAREPWLECVKENKIVQMDCFRLFGVSPNTLLDFVGAYER